MRLKCKDKQLIDVPKDDPKDNPEDSQRPEEQEAAKEEELGLRGHDDGNFGCSHRAIKREYLFVE